jgi:hypothetical protein
MLSIGVAAGCHEEAAVKPSIRDVKARYSEQLLAQPGVVMVGVGRDADGNLAIIVGMDGSRPETAKALPQSLEGYPVVTRIIGTVKAQ